MGLKKPDPEIPYNMILRVERPKYMWQAIVAALEEATNSTTASKVEKDAWYWILKDLGGELEDDEFEYKTGIRPARNVDGDRFKGD